MKVKRFAIASVLTLGLALILARPLTSARIPDARAAPLAPAAGVIYVDADAAGPADGLTWSTAFTNVQDALTGAGPGDEIWVAEGVRPPPGSPARPPSN